ncbi:TPA: N-acetylneuraminate synthase, partial [Candidatus Woesearchaeota archaeon]|nr:N-acetylneuraminate synthase [Candidatus Woesearchaeota archaeon]
ARATHELLRVIAIIPARGGSKRVPRKNIRLLAGKPLIYYTIREAKKSGLIGRLIVSTDDKEIKGVCKGLGVEVIIRPEELARDSTPMIPVLQHVISALKGSEAYECDIVVVLQPTSPLRRAEDIDNTIKKLLETGADSAETFCEVTEHPATMFSLDRAGNAKPIDRENYTKRSQELPMLYKENGAVYAVKTETLMKENRLYGRNHKAVIMPKERSLDIDDMTDFKLVELIMTEQTSKEADKMSAKAETTIRIGNRLIGHNQPCFIVAEAGVNHNGSIELAKRLIDGAKEAGADAVKFQTWVTGEIVTRYSKKAAYQEENWDESDSFFESIKKIELPHKAFGELSEYAKKAGIIFLSTPDDIISLDYLVGIGMPAIKIGSGGITDIRLLKRISEKNLPMILSTGMSTMEEVKDAVNILKSKGNDKLIILHCTSNYPARTEDVNLRAMKTLQESFNTLVGYSDHTQDIATPIAAVAMGACLVEKHFTLDKNLPGPDHKASLDPKDFGGMVNNIRRTEVILGYPEKKPVEREYEIIRVIRRSIVANNDTPKGTKLMDELLAFKLPGTGLPPKDITKVIGRKTKRLIRKDEQIKLEDLE